MAVGLGLALAGEADLRGRPIAGSFRSEYLVEQWGLEDGFPENSCSGIALAPDGALWLGTFRGLVRFNGGEFKPWGPPAMPALARTGIIAMFQDSRRRVWFTTDEGLVANEGGAWRRWSESDGWSEPRDFVRSWGEAPDGRLAFGRFSGGAAVLEAGRWRELPPLPGRGGAWCAFDDTGLLYGARIDFVGVLREGQWRPLAGDNEPGRQVLGLGQRRDGTVCILSSDAQWILRGGTVVRRTQLSRPVAAFWRLTEDRDGRVWASALADGVYRIQEDGTVRHFGRDDGLAAPGGTRIVHADELGAIWIGSGVGGLTRLRPPRFRLLGEAEGFGARVSLTLAPLPGGRVLLSTYGAGPMEFDGVGETRPVDVDGLQVRSLLRAADGTVWLGTAGAGLWARAGESLREEKDAGFTADETVMTLFEDSRRRLWAAGERTVVVREDSGFRVIALPPTGTRNRATFFAERKDGVIVLARRNEVYHWRPVEAGLALLCALPAEQRITSLLVDRSDRLWVGTQAHGLSVWNRGKLAHLGREQGLPGESIASLIEDHSGKLWFGSGRNLIRVDPADAWLSAVEAGRVLTFQRFDQHDGLRGLEFPVSFQPSAAKDAQGRLWFAFTRGAGLVDPAELRLAGQPPPVVVESLSYVPAGATQARELTTGLDGEGPTLPAGSRLIRIGYAAIDLQGPGKNRFRVRLGSAGQWQEMHQEATVSFLELPPGRHELRVQASGSDGVWNLKGATLRFAIQPHVWQTLWFRMAAILGGAVLIGGGAWWAAQRRVRVERERLARERRLAEAQARLALVLKTTSDLVLFAGIGGEVLFLNPAGWSLLGLETAAGPAAAGGALTALLGRMKTEVGGAGRPGSWTGESTVRHVSGREIPVSVVAGAHRLPDGTLEFVSAIVRDISAVKERSEMQDALRELAAGLNAARDAEALGRTIATTCSRLFAHDAFCLVLMDEVSGVEESVYFEDTAEDETKPAPRPVKGSGLSPGVQRVLAGETLLINRTGEPDDPTLSSLAPGGLKHRRASSLVFVPVWWTGRAIGVLSVQSYRKQRYGAEDVAHLQAVAMHCGAAIRRIRAEEGLRAKEARLRQAQKLEAVGTLAGGIAHDFNNILTAILGNAELVRMTSAVAPEGEPHIEQIRLSALRARDLVRRILAFSEPREVARHPVALKPLVEEAREMLRATLPATIALEVIAPDDLPLVPADGTELHQVLLNLATNARQALGSQPGRIEFRLESCEVGEGPGKPHPDLKAGQHVRVTVRDNGPGISSEVLPRIFDPFFTTKAPGGGSGLGLSVAHGIVRACGGAITVESEVGKGAAFHLYLPAQTQGRAGEATTPMPVAAAPASSPMGGRHILAVDDEPTVIIVLKRFLEMAGYTVTGCADPLAALRHFQSDPGGFDALVTDFAMPHMTGVELTRQVRLLRPELPVVLTSGYLREEDLQAAREAGVSCCLEKPGDFGRIVPALQSLLARP